MTFAILRALHTIIGDALDDIEGVYADASNYGATTSPSSSASVVSAPAASSSPPTKTPLQNYAYASPPPSPSVSQHTRSSSFPLLSASPTPDLDFPSLDQPINPSSPAEALLSNPKVSMAINRIVAACGQLTATVQRPFTTICDATMGYHLPSCMRLLEASNTPEILREAGPNGLHIKLIAEKTGVERNKLAHVLRLLATHHILREVQPNVFANNRISSTIDSGKSVDELNKYPETKHIDTNGIPAFVGMCTDELQKAAAYLTEAFLLAPEPQRSGRDPTRSPFNYAFGCDGVGFFAWLEGEGIEGTLVNGPGRDRGMLPGLSDLDHKSATRGKLRKMAAPAPITQQLPGFSTPLEPPANPNLYRLQRFGKAMTGTDSWEVPGAILTGFDWHSLPHGSIVVDVGGGIGSTSMMLANAFSGLYSADEDNLGLKFIIQDRQVVVDMGEKAWQGMSPFLLTSGVAKFTEHDFFTPQPVRNAAVFLLRVILHDWPDSFAERILIHLREAATPDTKLLLADFVLPLACADDFGAIGPDGESVLDMEVIEGAERLLAPAPLLANLGKASATVYWMDMTMQSMFNGQERTLREVVKLCQGTGWKVTKVVKAPGSLFGHITAVTAPLPPLRRARAGSGSALLEVHQGGHFPRIGAQLDAEEVDLSFVQSSSRCGTPTFGSRLDLPSLEETRRRFGGNFMRGIGKRVSGVSAVFRPNAKQPIHNPTPGNSQKKKPSPLSVPSSSPASSPAPSLRQPPQSPVARRGVTLLRPQQLNTAPSPSTSTTKQIPPPSPMSPRFPRLSLGRRPSFANLGSSSQLKSPLAPPPPLPPIPHPLGSLSPSPMLSKLPMGRRSSMANLRRPTSGETPPFPNGEFIPTHSHSPSITSSFNIPLPPTPRLVAIPASPELPRRKSHANMSPRKILGLTKKRSESLLSSGLFGSAGASRALDFGSKLADGHEPNMDHVHESGLGLLEPVIIEPAGPKFALPDSP